MTKTPTGLWVVVCLDCKASGTFCPSKAHAIERWNTRAPKSSEASYNPNGNPESSLQHESKSSKATAAAHQELRILFPDYWIRIDQVSMSLK